MWHTERNDIICQWQGHSLREPVMTKFVLIQFTSHPKRGCGRSFNVFEHNPDSVSQDDGTPNVTECPNTVCVRMCVILTQWDLLPRVSGQDKHQQSQSGDQDTWDEQVEAIVDGPPPHHQGEGDIRIRLCTAVVETLVCPPGNLCEARNNTIGWHFTHTWHLWCILMATGPSYRWDPTLHWRCSRWCPPPTSVGPETSPHMSRSQTSGRISGRRRGTSARQCSRCSWRSLLQWKTLKKTERAFNYSWIKETGGCWNEKSSTK